MSHSALFRVGVISDIQYADHPNGFNFQRTRQRFYRQARDSMREVG
jgi:hypothetical protein